MITLTLRCIKVMPSVNSNVSSEKSNGSYKSKKNKKGPRLCDWLTLRFKKKTTFFSIQFRNQKRSWLYSNPGSKDQALSKSLLLQKTKVALKPQKSLFAPSKISASVIFRAFCFIASALVGGVAADFRALLWLLKSRNEERSEKKAI